MLMSSDDYEKRKYEERKYEEIRYLRNSCMNVIEFIKKQQWLCVYYSLLLQGGIIGYFSLIKDDVNYDSSFLPYLSFLLAVLVTFVLMRYQVDLTLHRYNNDVYLETHFTIEARKYLFIPIKPNNSIKSELALKKFFEAFLIIFIAFNWTACILTLYYLKFYLNFVLLIVIILVSILIIRFILVIQAEKKHRDHLEHCKKLDNMQKK